MPPRAPYIDYMENNRMARAATRACLIHDHLMDAFRIKNGLDLDVGCRATPDPPCEGAKKLAGLYKDKGYELPLEFFINKCIGHEAEKEESPIDRKVLDRMKEIYCSFAASQELEIAPTNQYGDQQIMARTRISLKGPAVVLKGFESICFPIPEKHHTPPKYAKAFNEDYCFVNEKGKGFIQLGPASLLNHHCVSAMQNVKQFGADHKRRHIGDVIIFQPTLTRSVAAGEELCVNYGDDWFGENNRECLCSKGHSRVTLFPSTSWSSVEQTDSTIIHTSDTSTTPRASRMKRRLTGSQSARSKVVVTAIKPMTTRSKVGRPSRRTSFKDEADLQDIFASSENTSDEDEGLPSASTKRHVGRASHPSTSRHTIDKQKSPASSTTQKPASISTAKHILGSLSHARSRTGQTSRAKATQTYGANSSSGLTIDKHSTAISRASSQSPRLPVNAKAPASQLRRLSPDAPPGVTPPTSPTTRALVRFIGPQVATLHASALKETESIIHEDKSLEEETSLETLEEPNIMTPHIVHVPVNCPVPPLAQLNPRLKRAESPDLGSESSCYDRSLYGPSSPSNFEPSESAGRSVNGGPSVDGARSVHQSLDLDALDDEESALLVYGETTEAGDGLSPVDESSEAEPMDICTEDERSGSTRNEGL